MTTKWKVHNSTKADALERDFKVLNKIAVQNYATTAPVSFIDKNNIRNNMS